MLKKCFLLFLLFFISNIPLPSSAITPLKVAVLPVINTVNYRYQNDLQLIQSSMKKPFKYPYYTLIEPDLVEQVCQNYVTENKGDRLHGKNALTDISSKLSADLVIVTEISKCKMTRLHSFWHDETYIDIDIALTCYAYSTGSKKYDVIRVVKSTREPESLNTNTDIIFKELSEEILVKLPYKRIPLPSMQSNI